MSHARALIAEAIGTFALCFVGLLAIAGQDILTGSGPASLGGVALAHGLAITVMVAALSQHSGAHFNPAVTFGFVVARRMDLRKAGLYVAAQIAGALLASLMVLGMYGPEAVTMGIPTPAQGLTAAHVIVCEAVATFFLVLVIFGSAVDERAPRSVFPFAIGLVIVADILAIGPLTGAAMNPARVLGPAVAGNFWDGHWMYWVGPLLGGALAALLQDRVLLVRAPDAATAEHGGTAPAERRG
jgi:aquaporin TIP